MAVIKGRKTDTFRGCVLSLAASVLGFTPASNVQIGLDVERIDTDNFVTNNGLNIVIPPGLGGVYRALWRPQFGQLASGNTSYAWVGLTKAAGGSENLSYVFATAPGTYDILSSDTTTRLAAGDTLKTMVYSSASNPALLGDANGNRATIFCLERLGN